MASLCGKCRSNYFRVKDTEKFFEICNDFGLEVIEEGDKYGFMLDDGDGMPITIEDLNEELGFQKYKEEKFDVNYIISELLKDDEVMIIQYVGSENMRYFKGITMAYNNKGQNYYLDLDHIYIEAKQLGNSITICQY